MAKNQTVRVRPDILASDQDAYVAVQALESYQPVNPAYTKAMLTAKLEAMRATREAVVRAENVLAAARDADTAAAWEFHNAMLGVKDQVIAQFGPDSDEVQALGLKKKSERAKPKARKADA